MGWWKRVVWRVLEALLAPVIRRLDTMTEQEAALNVAIDEVKTAVGAVKTRVDEIITKLENKPGDEVPDLSDEILALKQVSSDLNAFRPAPVEPPVEPAPVEPAPVEPAPAPVEAPVADPGNASA